MKDILIVITFLSSLSCNEVNYANNYTNSSSLSFSLLKTSVDAALSIHPSVNTSNYIVNLSARLNLHPLGRDSFIIVKEKTLPVSHEDSALVPYETGKLRVLRSMIITIDTIKPINQKMVKVVARKIISQDSVVTLTLILGRNERGYSCIKCEESNP